MRMTSCGSCWIVYDMVSSRDGFFQPEKPPRFFRIRQSGWTKKLAADGRADDLIVRFSKIFNATGTERTCRTKSFLRDDFFLLIILI